MAASSGQVTSHTKREELWSQALSRLTAADRDQLQSLASRNHIDVLSDLLSLTKTSHQESLRKRWKYVRKNGEVVIIRDLFAKIAKWLDIFKQIGDQAVQYDPAHAALPWAGIRFVLQMAVNDINRYGRLVEIVSEISFIITRCTILENQYIPAQSSSGSGDIDTKAVMQSSSPEIEELRTSLINLYAVVLTLLAESKHYFDQPTLRRLTSSALKGIIDVEDSIDRVEKCVKDVDGCVMLNVSARQIDVSGQVSKLHSLSEDTTRLCERLSAELVAPVARMDKSLMEIKDSLDRKERTKILLWLSSQPYLLHHEQVKKGVIDGTGKWLLSDPVFQEWRNTSTSSVLWLHGIPGSGKSKLISIAIEESRRWVRDQQNPPAAFFYCSRNSNEAERSDPDFILSSIARQISTPIAGGPLFQEVVDVYEELESTGFAAGQLTLEKSIQLIIDLSCHYPVLTIFIDALDECDPERRSDLLDAFETILREASTLVKLMVSSRDDQDITRRLKGHMNLELASSRNADDIKVFVEVELDRMITSGKILRQSRAAEELRGLIIETLTKDAHGMFRWTSMQLEYLSTLKLDSEIRDRLGRLPPRLEQLYSAIYQEMLLDVTGIRVEVIQHVFKWLLYARHQLNTADMISFLRQKSSCQFQDLTEDHIMEFCRNFVTRDVGQDTFRFAHLSVREYLEKQPEYASSSCHALIAECCLLSAISSYEAQKKELAQDMPHMAHLESGRKFNSFEMGGPFFRAWAFSRFVGGNDMNLIPAQTYACTYWPYHCEKAEIERTRLPLSKSFKNFMLEPGFVAEWAWDISLLLRHEEYLQSESSYPCLRSEKLRACATPKSAALLVSCIFGFLEIVEIFVSEKLVDWDARNFLGSTALASAIEYGHRSIVSLLVGADARIPSSDKVTIRSECEGPLNSADLLRLLSGHPDIRPEMGSLNDFRRTTAVMRLVNANRDQFTEATLTSLFLVDDYDALLYQCQTVSISEDVSFMVNDPTMLLLLLEHPAPFSLSHGSFINAFAHMRQSKTLRDLLVKRWHLPVTEEMVWQALTSSRNPPKFLEVLFEFDHQAPISTLFMEHVFTSCPKVALLELLAKCERRLPITDSMAKRVRYKEGKSKDTVGLSRMIFPFGDNPLVARPFLYQTALIDRIPG